MAIYNGKHCVFEEVGVESSSYMINQSTNVDDDNCSNNWNISDMRTTTLPARLLKLSSNLQGVITDTTIQTAKNGMSSTLVSTSDKLFLAAAKEMSETPTSNAVSQENSALTTWSYWVSHTQNSDKIKYKPNNTAQSYRLRSPRSSTTGFGIMITNSGTFNSNDPVSNTRYISPCFAF